MLLAAALLIAAVLIVVLRGDNSKIVWQGYLVGLPFYLIPTLLVIWTFRFVKARKRRARIARGLCPACGYDVRAAPDRCSECGLEIAERVPARQTEVG